MRLAGTSAGFTALVRAGKDRRTLSAARRRAALSGVRGLLPGDAGALLRVPSERLAVYHELLVGGHQNMLRYALGATLDALACVQAARPRLALQESLTELIEAFLMARGGPKSHSLRELAETFVRFLRRRQARAFAAHRGLGDLARYELAELAVELEVDGPGRTASAEDLARLSAGTLDRLLRTRVLIPSYARLLAFRTDVPAALGALRGDDAAELADLNVPRPSYVVFVRDPATLTPRRHDVDAATFRDLRAMKVGVPFRLEVLLSLRARRGPRGETEEAAAGRVAAEALGLLQSGVLLMA